MVLEFGQHMFEVMNLGKKVDLVKNLPLCSFIIFESADMNCNTVKLNRTKQNIIYYVCKLLFQIVPFTKKFLLEY